MQQTLVGQEKQETVKKISSIFFMDFWLHFYQP